MIRKIVLILCFLAVTVLFYSPSKAIAAYTCIGTCYGPYTGSGGMTYYTDTGVSCNVVGMSVTPNPVVTGNSVTFSITSGDASTFISDTMGAGVDPPPLFYPSVTLTARTPGSYNWTHEWRHCLATDNDASGWVIGYRGCTVNFCPQSTPYTVLSNTPPTSTPTPSPTPIPPTNTPVPPTSTPTPTPTIVPPPAPNISIDTAGSCISAPHSGDSILTISWTNSTTPVSWVDILVGGTSYHKGVSSSSTSAPVGFNGFGSTTGALTIEPEVTYTVQLYNGTLSTPVTFTIPTCSSPTPTNTPPPPTFTPIPTNTSIPPTNTPTPTPTAYTTQYRCSDVKFEKDDVSGGNVPVWKAYQNDDFSGEPIRFKYTFTNNVVSGQDLTLFCQFKTDTGTTSQVYPKSIKYIGGNPKITNVSCTYDPSGIGTQIIVKGVNFGEHSDQLDGNVKVAGKDTTISFWAQEVVSLTQTSTESATISATVTPIPSLDVRYKIIAKLGEKLSAGKTPITLTTDDGRLAKGYCNLGTTTIDFTAKITCRAKVADLSQDNVSVEIKENVDKAKSLYKEKIKLDNEGKPVDFTPELEVGKNYQLTIRAPRTVSRKVNFTSEEGTTTLDDIIMPIGDIYPVSSPDNIINTFDKSEMTQEWDLITDVTRPADLNSDLRVNSVDYSCLLNNFNQSGN